MKIRFVTPPLVKQTGGIENAVEGLREALQRQGITVVQGGDPDDKEAIHHFHGLWDPSHSRLAMQLRKRNRPYVVSPHGMLDPWAFRHRRWKKMPYFWLFERHFLAGASSLFVTSSMELEHVARVIQHPRVEILPLGCRDIRGPDCAAARKALGWSSEDRVLLFLSRIDVKKGLHMLIQALARSGSAVEGWKLVIVGDGDPAYLAQLKATARAMAQSLPVLEWVGPVWGGERWPYIQGADLFCLPTHAENFGIAVLEAFYAGTPVMTTDQTPWRDYAQMDGVFITKPEVDSIASGILLAADKIGRQWTEADRTRLACWAHEHFAWENLQQMYAEAYERAVCP
ncbi:MAG: glycosyltransferase [Verrucomicrobia bacterium]|nr:glycosyltransferase [Verrucomicrobiota bacterium]